MNLTGAQVQVQAWPVPTWIRTHLDRPYGPGGVAFAGTRVEGCPAQGAPDGFHATAYCMRHATAQGAPDGWT